MVRGRAQIPPFPLRKWRCCMAPENRQDPRPPSWDHPTRWLSGIPSSVIVLRVLIVSCTSTRCPAKVRLRILRPTIVLCRQTAFSTRLRLL